ncbi:MAG: DUF6146 family protein [Bacteroidales bacterium]|jgi:hypothetical protein|nr:DUF6146 family protein [Bacteroidales bacterium]
MKRIFIFLVLISIASTTMISGQKGTRDTLKVGKDSMEYELIIIDPEFEGWLSTKPSMNYHSNEFYRQRNIRYVQEWNHRFRSPDRYGDLYETYIDYRPNIDYEIELNYRLYYYFVYFEEKNRVRLISRVR